MHPFLLHLMDVEEEEDWEYLPDAATYLLRDDGGGDASRPERFAANSFFNMDYFSPDFPLPPPANLLIPTPQFVPLQLPSPTIQAQEVINQLLQPDQLDDDDNSTAASQVFFKNNTEFVDMKLLDSSSTRSNPAATLIGDFSFEDKTDSVTTITTTSPRKTFDLFNPAEIATCNMKNDVNWVGEGIIGDDYAIDDDSGLNMWKLGLGGIGAICSFGVAAAAICLLIFGNSHKVRHKHKLSFQIYAADDNKRMKQVVQQATKYNEAMAAAVRGVPLNRARITYGGYYDNAL